MSTDDLPESGSSFDAVAARPDLVDAGPLGPLPRLSSRQARFEARMRRLESGGWVREAFARLAGPGAAATEVGRPEVQWRAAGLRRTGVVVQLGWPRLAARVAVGFDSAIAHAVVDRLLGFDRTPAEGRLSVSPVEWGVLTYAAADALDRLTSGPRGPLGVWDLTIDRVGPDPFDAAGLGRVVTLRWPVRVGAAAGSIRLWLPETVVARWLAGERPAGPAPVPAGRLPDLAAVWRAEAGTISLPRGLRTLRAGGVHPLVDPRLSGTPPSPAGPVTLTIDLADRSGRYAVAAEPVPLSGGGRLTVTARPRLIPTPREATALPPSTDHPPAAAADVPVTLVVELGRVNLPLSRLADLKPGDVVELARHSREPVELTSGGRLVARGELVQIDTELGVRVTHVFL